MSRKIYVTPREGLLVPDLVNRDNLPAEGREVDASIYWKRRENDGDVTVTPHKSAVKATKKGA